MVDYVNMICLVQCKVTLLMCTVALALGQTATICKVNYYLAVFSVDCSEFIRSTLRQSLPNKAGLKCLFVRLSMHTTYMRASICPQEVFSILMKFGM